MPLLLKTTTQTGSLYRHMVSTSMPENPKALSPSTASTGLPVSIAAPTVFVKGSRYDKMIEAFGGVGVNATSPDELKRAVNAAMDSGKPTLINAVLDPAAGSESGRIGNLNPQSKIRKK